MTRFNLSCIRTCWFVMRRRRIKWRTFCPNSRADSPNWKTPSLPSTRKPPLYNAGTIAFVVHSVIHSVCINSKSFGRFAMQLYNSKQCSLIYHLFNKPRRATRCICMILEEAYRTDGRTDRPSYSDAMTHLKTWNMELLKRRGWDRQTLSDG